MNILKTPEKFKNFIMNDIRRDLGVFYAYYWLDIKDKIYKIEVYEDKQIVVLSEPLKSKYLIDINAYEWIPFLNEDDEQQGYLNTDKTIIYGWMYPHFPIILSSEVEELLAYRKVSTCVNSNKSPWPWDGQ